MEENAERASESVEVVVWVCTLSGSKHIPIVRSAIEFADAVIKEIDVGIVTQSHPPIEEVQAIDSEWKEQAERHKSGLHNDQSHPGLRCNQSPLTDMTFQIPKTITEWNVSLALSLTFSSLRALNALKAPTARETAPSE